MSREIQIYKVANGDVVFNLDTAADTLWATEDQVARLFGVDRSVINRHIRNIYRDGELSEGKTSKEVFVLLKVQRHPLQNI